MILARYLLRAEKMLTPRLKLDDQKSVLPPSVQSFLISSPCSAIHPVLPDTSFTPAFERFHIIAVSYHRIGKLNGHIGRFECFRFEVILIIDVNDADDFMSATTGNLFYLFAHLSVTDQCYFHCFLTYIQNNSRKDKIFITFAAHINVLLTMEQLLHYVWKHKIFPLHELQTTTGLPVEVIDTGLPNSDSGPDFFNAKLKIGGTLW